eukprot:12908923-Prorocentrum_lima.AAC.1
MAVGEAWRRRGGVRGERRGGRWHGADSVRVGECCGHGEECLVAVRAGRTMSEWLRSMWVGRE